MLFLLSDWILTWEDKKTTWEDEAFMFSWWKIMIHIVEVKSNTRGNELLVDIKNYWLGINVEFSGSYYGCLHGHII